MRSRSDSDTGYFSNPKANEESFTTDGWFKTGDILYCDRKTKLWYIVDRKKVGSVQTHQEFENINNHQELIKVRGFQVAPPELEEILLAHPDIKDCAVIGVRLWRHSDTESPRAYVVRQPGGKITEKEIKRLISDNLASYKALTGGVVFLDEIPKSASGKILKRLLREQAEQEIRQAGARL